MIQVALTAKEEIVPGGFIEPYKNLCRSTELQGWIVLIFSNYSVPYRYRVTFYEAKIKMHVLKIRQIIKNCT